MTRNTRVMKCDSAIREPRNITIDRELTEAEVSAIVEMALSDHTAFAEIEAQFGLSDKQVKVLMRDNLKPTSYRNWRKRVREFSDRREHYK